MLGRDPIKLAVPESLFNPIEGGSQLEEFLGTQTLDRFDDFRNSGHAFTPVVRKLLHKNSRGDPFASSRSALGTQYVLSTQYSVFSTGISSYVLPSRSR